MIIKCLMTNAFETPFLTSNGLKPSQRLIAIVPAGGVGARAVTPKNNATDQLIAKQYQPISGVPMIRRAVMALLVDPRIDRVLVAVQPGDQWAEQVLLNLERVEVIPCAGATRALTVLGALLACVKDDQWVLVHDAARPGLTADSLGRLIDQCLVHPVGGLLALPVADTLKQAEKPEQAHQILNTTSDIDSIQVARTVARDQMWLAQTPQMFRSGMLQTALSDALKTGFEVTDEASAIEWAGFSPLLVRGSVKNAKVTWPEDFEWVGAWLKP
jgi:2-C-methyl-D-erythritol 4-phosphate cytidylyltransferase